MPYRTNEFERLLAQREALWDQTMRSLSNSVIVRQSLMADRQDEPLASIEAFDLGSLITAADPAEQQIRAVEQMPLRDMRGLDDLIGAAQFYGINNPERIPRDELEELIARRRESVRDYAAQQEVGVGRALYNGVATAIGQSLTTPGQQTLRILGNLAERIPFMREAVSRSEWIRDADRWFSMIQEGLTADLPEGRRELSRGVSGAIGMFVPAAFSWNLLGLTGLGSRAAVVGNRITPLGRSSLAWRAGLRGGLTETIIQDPTAPISEQVVNAAFGTVLGGAEAVRHPVSSALMGAGMGAMAGALADEGDPRTMLISAAAGAATLGLGHGLMNRVRRSFPSSALDADYDLPTQPQLGADGQLRLTAEGRPIDTDFVPRDQGAPTIEGDWVGENLTSQRPGGTDWQPAGELPPPSALEGVVEDPLRARVGRGQPWLREQSSLQDADYELIESLADLPPSRPGELPQSRPMLGPGQYEVYGVSGPSSSPEGPSLWMQTPPEVRSFVRRVVGERRAARRASEIDPMTQAGNRRAWQRAAASAESDPSMAIVAFDVNNLKAANDLVGHQFGDEMIQNASRAAQQAAEQLGIANRLFRLGGDEFVAIVPGDRVDAYRDAVGQLYGEHDAQGYRIALASGVGQSLEEADRALRAVKAGRNGDAYRNLNGAEAAGEAAQLSKQGEILESPALAELSNTPVLDDADVAWSVVESSPGQVGVVQNVGDVATTVRRILMDQMPNGVGPQDFRVVQRQLTPFRVYRGGAFEGIQQPVNTHSATEGIGLYASMNAELASEFGELTALYGGRGRTLRAGSLYLLTDEGDEIFDAIRPGDSEWLALHKQAVQDTGVTAENWNPLAVQERLTQLIRERGYTQVDVMDAYNPEGFGWKVFLDPSELSTTPRTQTDILVSSGRPISNKMVKEYEQFGMFSGQRAKISTGQEVVIESLGPSSSRVRPLYGGPTTEVATSDLLPMKSSAVVDDVPGFYEGFREFSAVRLDAQSREAGLAGVVDLFSDEGAALVPGLMEEFIRVQGVDPQSYYGATLRQLLEQRHIEAIRQLAPEEDLALLRSVQDDLVALQAEVGPLEAAPVEELAQARGMDVAVSSSGVDLVDDVSKRQIRVPVEDEGAAREFLHGFHRESIDDSPITPFPLEAIETPPGYSETTGAVPGTFRSAEQMADANETVIDTWERLGGDELIAELIGEVPGGGGAGGVPPIGPPPSGSFGGAPEPQRLPPGEDIYARHGEQWRRVRKTDPRRLKQTMWRLDNIIARAFVPTRNLLERAQQHARSLGVSTADYLGSMRNLDAQYNRVINDAHPWEERAYDILNPVRNRFWRDGTFWEVLNAPLDHQAHLMQNAGFKPEEREAVRQFKELMDDWIENVARPVYPEMGYRENYVTWYEQFAPDIPGDPWRRPSRAEWGPENPRGEEAGDLVKDMGAIIPRYFRSFFKAQYMQEPFEHMMRMVRDENVPGAIRTAVEQYAQTRMWGLDPTGDVMARGTEWILNTIGRPFGQSFSTQDAMKLWMLQFNAAYRSGLGGRVDPLVRDLPQIFMGTAQVGFDRGMPVLKRLLSDSDYGERARSLGRETGWMQEGGGASIDPDIFGSAGPDASLLREGLARANDFFQDTVVRRLSMRHGIQGTWLDWLTPYGTLGDFGRVYNGMVGYESATNALREYAAAQASRQSWSVPIEQLQQKLLQDSRVSRFQTGVQQTFLDYVNRGDYEGAARFFGGETAATQNLYGMAQQPRMWQQLGPITGKKAMQWLTFNSQTLANMAHIFADKGIRWQDKAAISAQMGAIQTAIMGAHLMTGWNFMRMSVLGVGFGFAGSGLFDIVNNAQRLSAWWQQFAPGQEPLSPDERAILGSPGGSFSSPFNPMYSPLNPWAGGMRSVAGLAESQQWGSEAVARFLTTGERGSPDAERLRQGSVEWETLPRSQIDEILQGGAGPIAPERQESQPGFGAMY